MLYHQNNHRVQGWGSRNITLIVLVTVSVFVLLVPTVRGAFTQAIYRVAPGLWGVGGSASGVWGSFMNDFRDKNSLTNDNALLRDEIEQMKAQVLDRNLLAERVTTLESALGRTQSDDRVAASVIVNQNESPYDILVIDAGSDNGIEVANPVVLAGSGVIGEVIETTGASSKVKLYSSSGVETPATVGSHHVPIVALGRGMGNFEAKISQDSLIVAGDEVVSSKGGLILGVISVVEGKPAEPFKRVYFREPFNITEIRSLEVVINKHS